MKPRTLKFNSSVFAIKQVTLRALLGESSNQQNSSVTDNTDCLQPLNRLPSCILIIMLGFFQEASDHTWIYKNVCLDLSFQL